MKLNNVTLEKSENTYLAYPATGELEIIEIGTDGAIIVAVFRVRYGAKGDLACPVRVRKPHFTYTHPY